MNERYDICCLVNGYHNKPLFEAAIRMLLARGHVFNSEKRFKSLEDIREYWGSIAWSHIKVGADPVCKMVLEAGGHYGGHKLVTVEDFLGLNYK